MVTQAELTVIMAGAAPEQQIATIRFLKPPSGQAYIAGVIEIKVAGEWKPVKAIVEAE